MITNHVYAERLYLDDALIDQKEKQAHIQRYLLVCQYLKPNSVILDAACGSGYGTKIIGKMAKKVIGIDLSPEAIRYAKHNYSGKNIQYFTADLNNHLLFKDDSFDNIVCFETIEHLTKQAEIIKEFNRILKPGGLLFISCPESSISQMASVKNPYHQKELSKKEFSQMISEHFSIIKMFGQLEFIKLPPYEKIIKRVLLMINPSLRRIIKEMFKIKKSIGSNIYFGKIEEINDDDPPNHFVTIILGERS